jgi:hypothetical protein
MTISSVGASSAWDPNICGSAPIADDPQESGLPDCDPSAQSGCITNEELTAWLAVVSANTPDDMRPQVGGTEQRRELQKELTSLKALIQETKETKNPVKLEAAMKELIAKYQGTPLEERVQEVLGKRLAAFEAIHRAQSDVTAAQARLNKSDAEEPDTTERDGASRRLYNAHAELFKQLDSWSTEIQG